MPALCQVSGSSLARPFNLQEKYQGEHIACLPAAAATGAATLIPQYTGGMRCCTPHISIQVMKAQQVRTQSQIKPLTIQEISQRRGGGISSSGIENGCESLNLPECPLP